MPGYSGTPLAKKLGIKEGARVALVAAPDGFARELEPLPSRVRIRSALRGQFDVIVFFATKKSALVKRLPKLDEALEKAGGLWLAWPKKASGVATDLSFDVVQSEGLRRGLVDNKICAVSEIFSGLRFVVRKENRSSRT